MTISLNTLKEHSVKAMGAVDSHIHDLALQVVEKAFKEGIFVQIISGFRSFAEQDALYEQGRTKPGSIVTHASAGKSVHNYGLAIDFLILTKDGDAHWTVDKQWHRVGAIGKSLGFSWGGDWESFKDWGHLEYTQGHGWIDLKEGWRPTFIEQMSEFIPNYDHHDIDGLLTKGDKGPAIRELQEKLIKAGEKLPSYGADGDFGDETENAVKAFQARYHLKVDGIVGPETMAALNEVLAKKHIPYPGTVLQKGDKGKNVGLIQRVVGVKVDDDFGPITDSAVKEFQKDHHLKIDGKVGPKTWTEMFK